jgi:hypothetical protein
MAILTLTATASCYGFRVDCGQDVITLGTLTMLVAFAVIVWALVTMRSAASIEARPTTIASGVHAKSAGVVPGTLFSW